MSRRSNKLSTKLKEAILTSEESNPRVVSEGTPAEALPFAEFSEQDINLQRWDNIEDKLTSTEQQLFEDPHEVHLPSGFTAHQWKRCSEIYPNANCVICTPMSTYPDLVTPNQHLTAVSGFFRNFVSSIEFLLYAGCNRPSPQEYEHNGFSTKGQNLWKPWYHIYSNCKITKGEHFPMYNPAGKYVVRLFWMGTWRKIYVDDLVPVDPFNIILLPTLAVPRLTVEHSLEDLSAVGKPSAKVKIKENIPAGCLWDVFMAYVKRFEWDNGAAGQTKKLENPKPKSKVEVDTPFTGSKAANPLGMKALPNRERFVALSCVNNLTQDDENSTNTFVFLSEVRDIPLIKPSPSPELEFWKKFRYEKWAVEQGLISPDMKKLDIKSLRIVNPFAAKRSTAIDNFSIYDDEKSLSESIESETLDICEEILLKKTFVKEASSSELSVQQEERANFSSKNHSINVVLEEYDWESNSVGIFIKSINTLGSESVIMELKPGRYSFRIWLTSHCPYVLQIFADKPLTIGSLEDYLIACSKESLRLTNLCQELSSSYGKLVQSFGTPDHSQCLKNLYGCYRPQQPLTKKELAITHKIFFEEFCKIATNSQDVVKAVELLFLQLKTFDYINPYVDEPHLDPQKFELSAQIEYAEKMQSAAVIIQAFFKQIYVRAMLRKFDKSHKDNSAIFGYLKKNYEDIFSGDKHVTCLNLFRKIFDRSELISFRNKFDIFQDTKSVLDLQIFNGVLVTHELTWISICRYDFSINFDEPILLKITLFSNLKTQFVRVFNNDNKNEVNQLFDNVLVEKYSPNNNGYTVVAYGFPPDGMNVDKINWQLVFATKKIYREDVLITNTTLTTLSLRDQYIPNFNNIICRYNVKVGTDAYLTANLTTSRSDVKICLRILDKNEKKIRELCGIKNVVFPLVELKFSEPQPNEGVRELVDNSKISSGDADTGKASKRLKKNRSSDSVDDINATKHDSELKLSARKSHMKAASKASLLGRSSKNSSKASHNTIREFAHTLYILEARVVDDSWPLTADEWNRVQNARVKNYVNYVAGRSQKKLKKSLSLTIEEPYWKLDLVYPASSVIEFKQDVTEKEQRKAMKMEWFEDPERYTRGTDLRDAYLQDHLEHKSAPSIDKCLRSNNKEDFALQVIRDEPLDDYMTKPLKEVDLDFCKTKNEDDYVIDEANRERQFKEYQLEKQATQDDIEGMLQGQMENFEVLSKWFKEIRNDSERALEMNRNVLIEKCTDVSRKVLKGSKKGREEKKK
ncbi:unnamed protein product [Ceutorhynchus assimilis]|uniref:Globin domain-containing protein n=1 Tax=Ceutorhynchus assimilis TaxID=467358 RepID=A0A9N9QQE5_9CUCU|nr:unnamed protein product [Ceutorhynchus assimilis]